MKNKIKKIRKENGTVIAETALIIPIFLMMFYACFEMARIWYVYNTCGIAAQAVAAQIIQNVVPYGNVILLSDFDQYATQIRFGGAVEENGQFSYDILDSNNVSLVMSGQAVGSQSRKVVVTVNFPPPNFPGFQIPVFDPGALVNTMMFPSGGVQIMASATALFQYSRRPLL